MENNKFYRVVGVISVLIVIAHVLRLLLGWEVVIAGWIMPPFLSIIPIIFFGWLTLKAKKFLKQ